MVQQTHQKGEPGPGEAVAYDSGYPPMGRSRAVIVQQATHFWNFKGAWTSADRLHVEWGGVGRLALFAVLGGSSWAGSWLLWSLLPPKGLTALILLLLLRKVTAGRGREGPLLLAFMRLKTSGL